MSDETVKDVLGDLAKLNEEQRAEAIARLVTNAEAPFTNARIDKLTERVAHVEGLCQGMMARIDALHGGEAKPPPKAFRLPPDSGSTTGR